MCSPRNESIILHARRPNCQLNVCSHLVFCFSWFFFAFSVAEKQVFHIVPFRPTRYVLKSFRCLEVSNRLRNWNILKKNIYVRSKILLSQLEIPIFINILMCKSSLTNSFSIGFCEFNRVANWNEGKPIIIFRSSFQIPKKKHWFPIQGQPMSM